MLTEKKVQEIRKKLPSRKSFGKVELQHSSLESVYEWITHSVYDSEAKAKIGFRGIVKKFPARYKWRIVKIKLK